MRAGNAGWTGGWQEPPASGASGPGKRRGVRRSVRRALAGGSIVGIAAGACAVALAATSATTALLVGTSSHAASKPAAQSGGKSGPVQGAPTPGPALPGPIPFFGSVLHATYTVQTGTNTYTTYNVQVGSASDVSQSGIKVTSVDGFDATYAVTSRTIVDAQRDGIGSIANNDKVDITATVTTTGTGPSATTTATATNIVDLTQVGGFCHWPGPFPQGPSSTQSSSGSSSTACPVAHPSFSINGGPSPRLGGFARAWAITPKSPAAA